VFGAADSIAAPSVADADRLAGAYYLSSVREVGAEIRLAPTGRFDYGLAYGGQDFSAQGRWSVQGQRLTLASDPVAPIGLKLGDLKPEVIEPYASDREHTSLLVVKVVTPRIDFVWPAMLVTAEFSNGMSRSGETGQNGAIAFDQRPEAQWKGASVKRIQVRYERAKLVSAWFDLTPETKTALVEFEPGDFGPQPAFQTMTLDIDDQSSGGTALIQAGSGKPGKAGWAYRRSPP